MKIKSVGKIEQLSLEAKRTIRIGLPVVAAQLLQMSMGFTDTIMAGNLSAKDLAAVAVGTSLVVPILVFVLGVVMAINPIVAQLHGGGQYKRVGQNLWQVLWLSQMLAIPCFFLIRNMESVMWFLNIRPEIIPVANSYLKAVSWGFPAWFAYFSLRFFNEGLTITKPSMYFGVVGLLFNVMGNYVFMYGKLGFPAMGAVGTGWATTMVWWVMLAGLGSFTLTAQSFAELGFRSGLRLPSWSYIKDILRIGVPNGVSIGIEVTMFALVALIIGSLGVDTVAGHQIAINVASFTFMIPLGLSIATTARVGFAIGKGEIQEARLIGYVGVGLSVLVMTTAAVGFLLYPETIVGMYTDDPEVTRVAVRLLFFAAIFQISDGLQVSVLGALRGFKDTKVPMIVNVLAYWVVGLPFGYFLGINHNFGADGLWIGLIAGLTVAAILHNVRYYRITSADRLNPGAAEFLSPIQIQVARE